MKKLVLVLGVVLLSGCSVATTSGTPPTPEIIYITAPPAPSIAIPTPIVIYVTAPPAPSGQVVTINGTFTLAGNSSSLGGGVTNCYGLDGYSDIAIGAPVTIKDASGTVVATSQLASAKIQTGGCQFSFTVPNVPTEPFYSIGVSHRGEITYSTAQLAAMNWTVTLTLGQ